MSMLLVADVGNSRIKLGRFEPPAACHSTALPEPSATCDFAIGTLSDFLGAGPPPTCVLVASVNRAATDRLAAALTQFTAERGEL